MLLRSITKHANEQNWFAVALDFFIVVAGILIAFQITNWSDERSDRALERHYLERLVEDIDKSIAVTDFALRFVSHNHENAWVVHQSVSSCSIAPGEENSFADGLYQFGRFIPVFYELGTVNEMQAAGNFSVIRNSMVRTRLNNLGGESRQYSELLQPISNRVAIQLAKIDRYLILNIKDIRPSSGSVTMDDIQFDLQAMCDDDEFLPALSTQRSINQFHIDRYNIALSSLKETRSLLQAELGLAEIAVVS